MEELVSYNVCTYKEVEVLLNNQASFWVSEVNSKNIIAQDSDRNRKVFLLFGEYEIFAAPKKEILLAEAREIMHEAKRSFLVPKQFNVKSMPGVRGILFCSGSNVFEEITEKGVFVERTDFDCCINCSSCVNICFFGARKMENNKLQVDQSKCFGCGLCVDMCPEYCIKMMNAPK